MVLTHYLTMFVLHGVIWCGVMFLLCGCSSGPG